MSPEILFIIIAFLGGIAFDLYRGGRQMTQVRRIAYQIVVIYLLCKIGFVGGRDILSQEWESVAFSGIMVVGAASCWTIIVLVLLKRWTSFGRITRISIAAHFGSVSVGTFIAGIAFLEAMNIPVNPSAAIWLALMEFPGALIGMWKLGIRLDTAVALLKKEKSLATLPLAIIVGALFGHQVPTALTNIIFGTLFIPLLCYFIFEMGRNAAVNITKLKVESSSIFFTGVLIPILGGFWGTSIGFLLGYEMGSTLIIGILMASASYVLAPLCMEKVLQGMSEHEQKISQHVVSTSMALSVGITLPFNIVIGLELYRLMIKGMEAEPMLASIGVILPFLLVIASQYRRS